TMLFSGYIGDERSADVGAGLLAPTVLDVTIQRTSCLVQEVNTLYYYSAQIIRYNSRYPPG
ncbi:MAG TPA: hypothetical protein VFK47_06830, partial [Ktedonobacteraceae bacterium]|nr:hypothetical protein [Ktedonobacteraceae bacterium]